MELIAIYSSSLSFFPRYIDLNFFYCMYCICMCVAIYMYIPLSVSVLCWRPASALCEHDPGYRALIVRCGMGCMPG